MLPILDGYEDFVTEANTYDQRVPNAEVDSLIGPALELSTETGEVLSLVKKAYRNGEFINTEEFKRNLILELGDVLWAVQALVLTAKLDVSLLDLIQLNMQKLRDRAESGDKRYAGN